MTLETETVLDRRRLRRNMAFWRGLAVLGVVAAIGLAIVGTSAFEQVVGAKQIARVSIVGTITEDREQLKMLKKIAESDNVQGMILYVNSPGGTTTGGEAIYEELRNIAKKKPVVAQFGTLAASAGYIVGLGTDHIVSRGNTITGSVGVVVQWPEVTELLGKIGVKMNSVKSGSLKAEPNPFTELDEEARKATEKMIADSFNWFVSLVEDRRKVKIDSIPGLRDGKVFSGREALRHNLVDQIGGEAEAIAWLEDKRGVEKNLKVVDWKKAQPGSFGLGAMISSAVSGLIGTQFTSYARLLGNDPKLSTLGLDGMLSVWHPAEN